MTRDEVRDILVKKEAIVTFTKTNGDLREMHCTLKPEVLPELVGAGAETPSSVLAVWDLEKDAWRSFRIDSIIKVEPLK